MTDWKRFNDRFDYNLEDNYGYATIRDNQMKAEFIVPMKMISDILYDGMVYFEKLNDQEMVDRITPC